MIKHILIALVLVIGLSGLGNGATDIQTASIYLTGQSGNSQYTNVDDTMPNDQSIVGNYSLHADYYFISYQRWFGTSAIIKSCMEPSACGCDNNANCGSATYAICTVDSRSQVPWESPGDTIIGNGIMHGTCDPSNYACLSLYIRGSMMVPPSYGYVKAYVIYTSDPIYYISGTTDCLSNVSLYYNNSGTWVYMGEDYLEDDDYYSFNVTTGIDFKLLFDDGHSHVFNVTGDTVYNYNACPTTHYRFEESCGNLIPDTEGWYCMDYISGGGICNNFDAPNGILDMSNISCASITLYTNTFVGEKWWYINPVLDNHTYNVINTALDWKLKVIVQNECDGTLIDDAMVRVNQTCYCTHEDCIINPDQSCTCGGHSTRQKKTVSGTVGFTDMSLQDASLFVMKTGYKILNENTTGYSAFLSGHSNFSSKTWIVKLANSTSNNSSSFYEVANKVDIHFRDVTGNLTSKILDTDAYVDLYYQNNNTEEEAMTLRFESSSTHTYFMPERTYTIAHDDSGYKRITNGYFTPWEYSYRAVIYNSSIYGWNITIPLTVRNGTRETEHHYENLTTGLWFMYASDGKVDYRDDMKVAIHAGSNNTTLLKVDVELWKDGVYIACKNLTAADFTGADFPYYYVWNPVFDYISGSNYSVRMYGFDRTLLETDYVVCVTDDTTRKNKLTIGVKDRAGGTLNNCYIYLEHWGSLPTGSTYYNAYEGIDNGDYRYKATKSGYSGGGWESVNLTDEDKIVWYVLSEDYTNTSTTAQKFTDDDIKGFFFPLMFFLLICIVLGGLKYVAS